MESGHIGESSNCLLTIITGPLNPKIASAAHFVGRRALGTPITRLNSAHDAFAMGRPCSRNHVPFVLRLNADSRDNNRGTAANLRCRLWQ